MNFHRVIARLDIKGPNLVKGIHLEGLRVLGSPKEFAEKYFFDGADELFYQDVVASLYNRNSILKFISQTAETISIPLTVGGGIRSTTDIKEALEAGADKVAINTAAIKNPEIIKESSRIFGSSTIVASVEAIKSENGDYLAYTDNGREYTGINVTRWCQELEKLGAGEILLTSIDHEGTGTGYDIDLINSVRNLVNIPIIAHGGFGNSNHIIEAIKYGKANAVALASMLHYGSILDNNFSIKNNDEGNVSFLNSKKKFKSFEKTNLKIIKNEINKEVQVRV